MKLYCGTDSICEWDKFVFCPVHCSHLCPVSWLISKSNVIQLKLSFPVSYFLANQAHPKTSQSESLQHVYVAKDQRKRITNSTLSKSVNTKNCFSISTLNPNISLSLQIISHQSYLVLMLMKISINFINQPNSF